MALLNVSTAEIEEFETGEAVLERLLLLLLLLWWRFGAGDAWLFSDPIDPIPRGLNGGESVDKMEDAPPPPPPEDAIINFKM